MVSLEFFSYLILPAALWPWGRLITEMSTRDISWGNRWLVCRADNLTTLMCRLSRNSGNLNLLEPYGIFPKIHTSLSSRMCYKWCSCGYHRSVIKGTLFAEQCAFPALSQFPLEEFPWIFIRRNFHARATNFASFVAIAQ